MANSTSNSMSRSFCPENNSSDGGVSVQSEFAQINYPRLNIQGKLCLSITSRKDQIVCTMKPLLVSFTILFRWSAIGRNNRNSSAKSNWLLAAHRSSSCFNLIMFISIKEYRTYTHHNRSSLVVSCMWLKMMCTNTLSLKAPGPCFFISLVTSHNVVPSILTSFL